MHTVADVYCMGCNDRMGWYYHKASDHSQKYKEGESVRGAVLCGTQHDRRALQASISLSGSDS